MFLGFALIVIGIVLFVITPLLGLIPAIVLVVVGLVVMVLGGFARGAGAVLRAGTTKTCPECRSRIPSGASVCRYCGYRYR